MKILICSKLFYPSNRIGAVRPSNFAKYLAEMGHDVTVVTSENVLRNDFSIPGVRIIRIAQSPLVNKLIKKYDQVVIANSIKSKSSDHVGFKKNQIYLAMARWARIVIKNFLSKLFYLTVEFDWFLTARKKTRQSLLGVSFDFVLSSYGPLSSFMLGKSVAKARIGKKWVCDLRDNMVSESDPAWLNFFHQKLESQAIKSAQLILLVSEGQRSMFLRNNSIGCPEISKIRVLYNGYENPISAEKGNRSHADVLRIAYTGQLYDGLRDFSLLFHVLDDLIFKEIIERGRVLVEYAGPSSSVFNLQANKFRHVKEICIDHGAVSREKALEIQRRSSVVVALTWNTRKEQGVITGKFLEYLQLLKPVISITSGDLPGGELTQMVREMNLGIACEYFNYNLSYTDLEGFILEQYNSIVYGRESNFKPNYKRICEFQYWNIVKQLEEMLFSLLQNGESING